MGKGEKMKERKKREAKLNKYEEVRRGVRERKGKEKVEGGVGG